ncbi:hypothetical protein K7X08_025839 [Anisodus acutangulus]|uniref:Uncharacterized protein n=1 Tax=Anisodus acutangulus TaxID=402998 RepID=A0A9Q1LBC5_9SOLA|nr:hypothetical protein K7X08_025839 [Anisodus acutangulus]
MVDYPNGSNNDKKGNKGDKGQTKKRAATEVQVQVQNKVDVLNVVKEREQNEPNQLKPEDKIAKENGINRPSEAQVDSNEHRIEMEKTNKNEDVTTCDSTKEGDSGRLAEGVDDKNFDEECAMQLPIQVLPAEELRVVVNSLDDLPPDILQEAIEVALESETFIDEQSNEDIKKTYDLAFDDLHSTNSKHIEVTNEATRIEDNGIDQECMPKSSSVNIEMVQNAQVSLKKTAA